MIEQNDSPYVNIVATKTTNKDNKDIKTIVETLHEAKVQQWIEKKWAVPSSLWMNKCKG